MKARVTVKNRKKVLRKLDRELYYISNFDRVCLTHGLAYTMMLVIPVCLFCWYTGIERMTFWETFWTVLAGYVGVCLQVAATLHTLQEDANDIREYYAKIEGLSTLIRTTENLEKLVTKMDFVNVEDKREDKHKRISHVTVYLANRDYDCKVVME